MLFWKHKGNLNHHASRLIIDKVLRGEKHKFYALTNELFQDEVCFSYDYRFAPLLDIFWATGCLWDFISVAFEQPNCWATISKWWWHCKSLLYFRNITGSTRLSGKCRQTLIIHIQGVERALESPGPRIHASRPLGGLTGDHARFARRGRGCQLKGM